jgi:hypothetical protein
MQQLALKVAIWQSIETGDQIVVWLDAMELMEDVEMLMMTLVEGHIRTVDADAESQLSSQMMICLCTMCVIRMEISTHLERYRIKTWTWEMTTICLTLELGLGIKNMCPVDCLIQIVLGWSMITWSRTELWVYPLVMWKGRRWIYRAGSIGISFCKETLIWVWHLLGL